MSTAYMNQNKGSFMIMEPRSGTEAYTQADAHNHIEMLRQHYACLCVKGASLPNQ